MGELRIAEITAEPLTDEMVRSVLDDPAAGGIVVFTGVVRDHDEGRSVTALSYSAHPSAGDALREVAFEVSQLPDVIAVGAVHRVGDLQVGDIAVVVGVSCAHRGDAFSACRTLIDDLKTRVPIWKSQSFADGTSLWVGSE